MAALLGAVAMAAGEVLIVYRNEVAGAAAVIGCDMNVRVRGDR